MQVFRENSTFEQDDSEGGLPTQMLKRGYKAPSNDSVWNLF